MANHHLSAIITKFSLIYDVIGRVQQTQLLRSGSVSARCYWMIYKNISIAASVHGSAPQQLNLLNTTIIVQCLTMCLSGYIEYQIVQ